jgi:hypothetical protein
MKLDQQRLRQLGVPLLRSCQRRPRQAAPPPSPVHTSVHDGPSQRPCCNAQLDYGVRMPSIRSEQPVDTALRGPVHCQLLHQHAPGTGGVQQVHATGACSRCSSSSSSSGNKVPHHSAAEASLGQHTRRAPQQPCLWLMPRAHVNATCMHERMRTSRARKASERIPQASMHMHMCIRVRNCTDTMVTCCTYQTHTSHVDGSLVLYVCVLVMQVSPAAGRTRPRRQLRGLRFSEQKA